jgi:hypothetical protein
MGMVLGVTHESMNDLMDYICVYIHMYVYRLYTDYTYVYMYTCTYIYVAIHALASMPSALRLSSEADTKTSTTDLLDCHMCYKLTVSCVMLLPAWTCQLCWNVIV